jgi:adenosine deaminase
MLVDLHVHLRGTVKPLTVQRLAKRNGIVIPKHVLAAQGYGWYDFTSFLSTYDLVASAVATARDLEEVTYSYLRESAAQGTVYVEFMLSPPDLLRRGVAMGDQLATIQAGADRAYEECGIECRLIATAVRHLGPEAAVAAAELAADQRTDLLVGFGLTGDERQFEVADFREAFRIARSAGLRTTAHAGEHLGAESILRAIEELRLDRVGHGVRAVESESVVRQLATAKIPLEICLSSNLALGLFPDLAHHPIASLAAAGCAIVLGTDDPSFFDTSPEREYALAERALRQVLSIAQISSWAVDSAFCDNATRARLRQQIARIAASKDRELDLGAF